MDLSGFEARKRDHIRLSLDSANQADGMTGLSRIRLVHEALPDLDWDDISLESPCLGQSLTTPFFVSGMTAGHAAAAEINHLLAKVCSRRGWAMGVGSQRRELEALTSGDSTEKENAARLDQWEKMRDSNPGLFLIGNIGITQLIQSNPEDIEKLLQAGRANALAVHLNALQEVIQLEGTPQFRGGFEAIRSLSKKASVPLVIKETGCGFSAPTLTQLSKVEGLKAVDVSGLGGTHWGRIEGSRAEEDSPQARAAKTFAHWGVPTTEAVQFGKEYLKDDQEVWASGGVRSGHEAAQLIALGAHRVGFAKPALEAAVQGEKMLDEWMAQIEFELQIAIFCTGCLNPQDLRKKAPWTVTQA